VTRRTRITSAVVCALVGGGVIAAEVLAPANTAAARVAVLLGGGALLAMATIHTLYLWQTRR
jgi:hypothetical protein